MWFRIHSAHWMFPLVTKSSLKIIWSQLQFPTTLVVTQPNINYLLGNAKAFTVKRVQSEFVAQQHLFSLASGIRRIFLLSHPLWAGSMATNPTSELVIHRCKMAFGCWSSTAENAAEPTQSPISSEGCPSDHTVLLQTIVLPIPLIWLIFIIIVYYVDVQQPLKLGSFHQITCKIFLLC